jgi:hypothetical protein
MQTSIHAFMQKCKNANANMQICKNANASMRFCKNANAKMQSYKNTNAEMFSCEHANAKMQTCENANTDSICVTITRAYCQKIASWSKVLFVPGARLSAPTTLKT